MRLALVWVCIVGLFGCVAGEPARARRWPEHRRQGDARFAELERRADALEARVTALTKELAAARAELAKLSAPSSSAATASP